VCKLPRSGGELTAQLAVRDKWVEVQSAWVKSRLPTEEFGFGDFPNFSTMQNISCSDTLRM